MSLLWLRNETKLHEKRTPLIPSHAAELIKLGHKVCVETSAARIFPDFAYHQQGCELVPAGSWPQAPQNAYILGLKHIEENNFPLIHHHIYFAHAYNHQRVFTEKYGITQLMQRFLQGGGCHYDFEFLINDHQERVTAFGKIAGLAGAALAIILYAQIKRGKPLEIQAFYANKQQLQEQVNHAWYTLQHTPPLIAIIGANGRCGTGVQQLLSTYSFTWDAWRKEDILRKKNKPFTAYDILFNCAYIQEKIPPFLTSEQIKKPAKLSFIADISCETSGNTPLPIYSGTTSYSSPTHYFSYDNHSLHIMAIDNLPAFLPYESSIDFSTQCLPHFKSLLANQEEKIWQKAKRIFTNHIKNFF